MTTPKDRPAEVTELLSQIHNAPKESLEIHSNAWLTGIAVGNRKTFAAVDTTFGEGAFICAAANSAPKILEYVTTLEDRVRELHANMAGRILIKPEYRLGTHGKGHPIKPMVTMPKYAGELCGFGDTNEEAFSDFRKTLDAEEKEVNP